MAKRKIKYQNTSIPKSNMHSRQIMLTISILVSGRGDSMEKCIASLEHLRRTVSCELILTDTGCSEEMQEWLKQKADKVLKFKWCDDFAAARNVGLRAARGQWFMFMDDDEWFENTTRIEAFFLSGEYRKYQSASYVVRNYANMEGTVWRDIHLTRMTVRRPDTRFFYPIHESLWPLLEPEKYLEDYAHHYGYASADPEVQMAKRKRNLGILLSAIQEDPHCMKHYLQAVAEYYAMDDWEAAARMADTGIASCDPSREENAIHIDGLYAASTRMRLRGKKSLETVRVGKAHLEKADLSELARASICSDLAIAYGELGEDEACLKYLRDYLDWKAYFANHREKWLKQETVILDSCFENFQYRKAMGWGFAAALSAQAAKEAERLLSEDTLEWWLDAVRGWYTLASEQRREKWQNDFRVAVDGLEGQNKPGGCMRTDGWVEGTENGGCLWQLYRILTMPEPDIDQGMTKGQNIETGERGAEPVGQSVDRAERNVEAEGQNAEVAAPAPDAAASQEIAALAVQLKEKIRLLIQQGQHQAALAAIGQLQGFFPKDEELARLREECEV